MLNRLSMRQSMQKACTGGLVDSPKCRIFVANSTYLGQNELRRRQASIQSSGQLVSGRHWRVVLEHTSSSQGLRDIATTHGCHELGHVGTTLVEICCTLQERAKIPLAQFLSRVKLQELLCLQQARCHRCRCSCSPHSHTMVILAGEAAICREGSGTWRHTHTHTDRIGKGG